MANNDLPPRAEVERVYNKYKELGSCSAAARALGIPRTTVRRWVAFWEEGRYGAQEPNYIVKLEFDEPTVKESDILKDKIRQLETQLKLSHKESLTEHYVREKIIGLSSETPQIPKWVLEPNIHKNWEAVPTLFLSDLHWGEVVDPSQIGGANEYNLNIASTRMKTVVNTTMQLLDIIDGEYPGIVLAVGGDLVSGDIHEELMATNEAEIMPIFMDLYGVMIWVIQKLADEYGQVFIPWVAGNHGRDTVKIRAKGRNFTNFDWLMGCLLEKHFENDDRITFQISNGSDTLYRIYGVRYLLTHGDQFRGGDGMIGALGPIIRGDHKKRSRNNQIDMGYDVLLLGHWHQLIQMQRLIVNGSTKGYDEYAYANNFPYEPPRQALWLTHADHGIIMSMPVNAEKHKNHQQVKEWVSWK